MKVLHETAVEVPGIGYPGGNQLPFKQIQSGPGFTVVQFDGGGGGGSGGGSVGGGGGGGGGVPPGIGNPGGSQLPLKQVQSGPGFTVGQFDGGGSVAADPADLAVAAVAAADPRGSGIRAAASCR